MIWKPLFLLPDNVKKNSFEYLAGKYGTKWLWPKVSRFISSKTYLLNTTLSRIEQIVFQTIEHIFLFPIQFNEFK